MGKLTFGKAISSRRKELGLSLKQLAEKILREDREDRAPISVQYLNDIEHDRRRPSSDSLVKQFAKALELEEDWLYYLVGRIPADMTSRDLPPDKVVHAMQAFRRRVKGG